MSLGPAIRWAFTCSEHPELSATAVVAPDGRISLPLVPDIIANGKTAPELSKDIEAKLKEYVKEPKVSVIVNGFVGPSSRQVRVIGEGDRPDRDPVSRSDDTA